MSKNSSGTVKALVMDWGNQIELHEAELAQEERLQAVLKAHGGKLTPKAIAALEAA